MITVVRQLDTFELALVLFTFVAGIAITEFFGINIALKFTLHALLLLFVVVEHT